MRNKQLIALLEYQHEDICFMWHLAFLIMCFGFQFRIAAVICAIMTVRQFIYAVKKNITYKKERNPNEN